MGEHDIAVTMDKLKFVEEPVGTTSTNPPTTDRRDYHDFRSGHKYSRPVYTRGIERQRLGA